LYFSISKFFNRRSEFDIRKVSCLPQALFARKKEKENSAPQFCGAGYKAAKNWELFLCACLPQAGAAKSISTLFP
jgi:hypothetical protein